MFPYTDMYKKSLPCRIAAVLLSAAMLLISFSACSVNGRHARDPKSQNADLTFSSEEKTYPYSFLSTEGEQIGVSEDAAEAFYETLDAVSPVFPMYEYFGLEETMERLSWYTPVAAHQGSALDENGNLTAAHLVEIVKENNSAWFETRPKSFFTEPSPEYLLSICTLIVDTVNAMRQRVPDIDWQRVYCNLSDLKVYYKSSCLSLAQVTEDMALEMGDAMLSIGAMTFGDHTVRNTLIHEILHILQLGCRCEQIPHCTRRAGVCCYYDDLDNNNLDWNWLFEGSAEKGSSLLTGDDTITYSGYIGYIQSLNVATFLREDLPAHYAEQISFYPGADRLFDLFYCETDADDAVDIMQDHPDGFMRPYCEDYGLDAEDDEVLNDVSFKLKPAVCIVFAKTFFRTLTAYLCGDSAADASDVYCILRLFEASMCRHLRQGESAHPGVNDVFYAAYFPLREAFFGMFASQENAPTMQAYLSYGYFAEAGVINASLKFLPEAKRRFVAERTDAIDPELLETPLTEK